MDTEKHHYVPKVYLKQFSKDFLGHFYAAGPKPLYLKTVNPRHAEQVCYIHDFYTLNERTLSALGIDDAKFLETKAFDYEKRLLPRIFSKLNHKNVYLNKSYHDRFIDIYLSFKQRNAYYRNIFMNHDLNAMTDREIEKMKPAKKWIEEVSGQNYDHFMGKIKHQIISDNELPGELHKRTLIETAIGQNSAINDAKRLLLKMSFYVLEPLNNSDFFITSDNPGFSLLGKKVFNTNFGRFDSVGFPINSKQLVFLTGISSQSHLEIHKKINFAKIGTKEVHLLNCCTVFNANEHVFCESKKYLTEFVVRFENEYSIISETSKPIDNPK